MKSAQPSSTQAFTEILDIRENIVLLKGGNACIVLNVTSVNFALLSGDEQDAKVIAYAELLNSLSFPIQILVRSKPVQITPYIRTIALLVDKTTDQNLKTYMSKYKDFVTSLVQTTTVLDKQFYVIISYSGLEAGASSIIANAARTQPQDAFFEQAKTSLETKADSLLSQIHRLSLRAKILEKEELIKLFYDIYNQGESFATTAMDIENPIVKGISI